MRCFQSRQWLKAPLAAVFILLSACASPTSTPTQSKQIAAIASWPSKGQLLIIEVPAASNAISNQMMVASLKVGALSNAADQILQVLRKGSASTVAVTGKDLDVNAATVQAVLREWGSTKANTNTTLLMAGRSSESTELEKAAAAVGIKLEFASLP